MKKIQLSKALNLFVSLSILSVAPLVAEEKIEKVGGDYHISRIDRLQSGKFRVEFQASPKHGKFATILLTSDNVHLKIKIGQKVRLSAEVEKIEDDIVHAAQVVLIDPEADQAIPIWMISSAYKDTKKKPAKKLFDQHSPNADFVIL